MWQRDFSEILTAGLLWAVDGKIMLGAVVSSTIEYTKLQPAAGQTSLLQKTMEHCAGEAGSSSGFRRVWPSLFYYVLLAGAKRREWGNEPQQLFITTINIYQ